jgi:SpoVK/Ycf46/Vps4 family AAA+-type ATPase
LSTNLKDNVDTAFLRRFQIITEFALPDRKQRLLIWQKLLKELSKIEVQLSDEDYTELSKTELSGGAITNIVNFALLKANFTKEAIKINLLKEGIVRELRKENRLTSL